MVSIWFALLSLSGAFAASIDTGDYVGEKAARDQFLFIVSVRKESPDRFGEFYHVCGGSTLSDKIILTAAHCLNNSEPENIRIAAGAYSRLQRGELFEVDQFIKHPNYRESMFLPNDVAVIKLMNSIPMWVFEPVPLGRDVVHAGEKAIILRWLHIYSTVIF